MNDVRDAQGNVMATYQKENFISGRNQIGELRIKELNIYGSNRIGLVNCDGLIGYKVNGVNTVHQDIISTPENKRTLGIKSYELNNHLGNVLTVVSDRKIPVDEDNDDVADYFVSDIVSANDYYAFGMVMPSRKYSANSYRYGFNGKENDKEIVGTGDGTQDYGFRIYNPAVGRFLSLDPLTKEFCWNSPFAFAENRPVEGIDLEGLEFSSARNVKVMEVRTTNAVAGFSKMLFGIIGSVSSAAYIGSTAGIGAAVGGAAGLSASIGEIAIGVTQMASAFTGDPEMLNASPTSKAGSVPGLIAYSSNIDEKTAALVDGVTQVATGGNPIKNLYEAPKELLKAKGGNKLLTGA